MTPRVLVTQKKLWKEFLPLSLSDVTMACSDPLVNSTLAHLPGSHIYMASLGIAKSLIVCFESPIIMMLHASNALAEDLRARRLLWRFMLLTCAILTSLLLFISLPKVFPWFATHIMGVAPLLLQHVHLIILWLLVWPGVIGWRRYYQGLLIHGGHTKVIGQAGLGRIITVALILAHGISENMRGDVLSAMAIIGGIIMEALLVTIAAYKRGMMKRRKEIPLQHHDKKYPQSLKEVFKFYWPLGNSMMVVWGGRAVLVAILAHSRDALVTLAAWPAAWGLVLVIANATRMVQQVIIRHRGLTSDLFLVIFAVSVGSLFTVILLLLGITPIGQIMLQSFVGKDPDLMLHVKPVVLICCVVPLFLAVQNAIQGFLISEGNTGRINYATWIGTSSLLIFASLGIQLGFHGTTSAAFAMLISLCLEMSWLCVGLVSTFKQKPLLSL